MAVDDASPMRVLNYYQPACFRELRADEKHQCVTPFLHVFLIGHYQRANVFLPNQSVLFVLDMVWVYVTASAMKKKQLVTNPEDV